MTDTGALARGRTAYEREAWASACDLLAAAHDSVPLDPEDLDRWATAAYLVGRDDESVAARSQAHQTFLERGEPRRAARSAFWLAFVLIDQPSQQVQAGGWLARAGRLLEQSAEECAEQGLLLFALGVQKVGAGDPSAAHAAFSRAAQRGVLFRDPDLTALARHGEGRALLQMARAAEGFSLIDEVMVAITCGEVGAMVAGVVYCSVISACHDMFDLRRAQAWTTALAEWCASRPDMVAFRGQCLIRRSELLQLHGEWEAAVDEARRACDRLTQSVGQPAVSAAYCQLAELYRLRGDFERADQAYRQASQAGLAPHPGIALLRLAQGQVDTATAAIRHVLQESRGRRRRALALIATVEILLVGQDVPAARDAADQLSAVAVEVDAPFLHAAAAQARGAVALSAGATDDAVAELREASTLWTDLGAPYQRAQARVLIGRAYRLSGDEDGARLEFDVAQEGFEQLGAAPDVARVAALLTPEVLRPAGGLTGRELAVLRLVASGKTNRMIAAELSISEKTVARHVSNIFTKLDLPSRSAATAYAYEHNLL